MQILAWSVPIRCCADMKGGPFLRALGSCHAVTPLRPAFSTSGVAPSASLCRLHLGPRETIERECWAMCERHVGHRVHPTGAVTARGCTAERQAASPYRNLSQGSGSIPAPVPPSPTNSALMPLGAVPLLAPSLSG